MSGELKSDIRVLNARSADNTSKQTTVPTAGKQQDAVSVSQQLQKLMLRMKGEFMKEDGTGVNYSALKLSDVFKSYKAITQDLIGISLETLDRTQKMVFFINIYNALTIHGLVECDKLPNSVLDIRQFWRNTAYNISGHIFSLDDIEHGILRGNRPHPAANDPHFSSKDPRVKFVVEPMDPRIHFALVCGAKIELSRIFQWYRTDFGADEIEAVRWTLKYLCEDKVYGIETMLDVLLLEGGVRISYSDYNWQLNKA
ncbi:uncharacterized protein [Ptychodera flava]|uniref:uncharacterized protein isoform X2 n=1 Tax=Ptychodera flava TaxID=63121 RepID=UPI00396A524F